MRVNRPCLMMAIALVVGVSLSLSAHMKLAKSAPAAGSTVSAPLTVIQVWFSQAPDIAVSKLELSGPSGAVKLARPRLEERSLIAAIEGETPAGAYTVSWQSAGDDGHVQKGTFRFTLAAPK